MEMAYGLAEKAAAGPVPTRSSAPSSSAAAGSSATASTRSPASPTPRSWPCAWPAPGQGATLYLTLEPCVHGAGRRRASTPCSPPGSNGWSVSAVDPNPVVHRKGLRRLRQAGIDVSLGLLAERNARMNESYAKYITRKVPFVTLKAALTLDGKIACRSGDSKWISIGRDARLRPSPPRRAGRADGRGQHPRGRRPLLTVRHRAGAGRRSPGSSSTRACASPSIRGSCPRWAAAGSSSSPGPERGAKARALAAAASRSCFPPPAGLLGRSPTSSKSSAAARSPRSSSRAAAASSLRSSRPGWPTRPS